MIILENDPIKLELDDPVDTSVSGKTKYELRDEDDEKQLENVLEDVDELLKLDELVLDDDEELEDVDELLELDELVLDDDEVLEDLDDLLELDDFVLDDDEDGGLVQRFIAPLSVPQTTFPFCKPIHAYTFCSRVFGIFINVLDGCDWP